MSLVGSWVMLPCTHCERKFGKMKQLIEHKREAHNIGVIRRTLSQAEIKGAIMCPNWQGFRIMLKGQPTERKLQFCSHYLQVSISHFACEGCGDELRQIQVLNYLNALARGGLIKPVPDLVTMNLLKYWHKIEVIK